MPIPVKKGQGHKKADGGVRQRVEMLGGLRCIVAEKEGAAAVHMLVVLLHGVNVLGDDLFGLVHHAALLLPGVRFLLPEAPHESSTEKRANNWSRSPRQWFPLDKWSYDKNGGLYAASTALGRAIGEARTSVVRRRDPNRVPLPCVSLGAVLTAKR